MRNAPSQRLKIRPHRYRRWLLFVLAGVLLLIYFTIRPILWIGAEYLDTQIMETAIIDGRMTIWICPAPTSQSQAFGKLPITSDIVIEDRRQDSGQGTSQGGLVAGQHIQIGNLHVNGQNTLTARSIVILADPYFGIACGPRSINP